MSTRISSFGLLLLLTACNNLVPDKVAEKKVADHKHAIEDSNGVVECAVPGSDSFAYECAVERMQTQDGLFLTLRHPDGSFHRLLVTSDGRGVVAADGAEQAVVTPIAENRIEVALAGARYRLPATVKPPKAVAPEQKGK